MLFCADWVRGVGVWWLAAGRTGPRHPGDYRKALRHADDS